MGVGLEDEHPTIRSSARVAKTRRQRPECRPPEARPSGCVSGFPGTAPTLANCRDATERLVFMITPKMGAGRAAQEPVAWGSPDLSLLPFAPEAYSDPRRTISKALADDKGTKD